MSRDSHAKKLKLSDGKSHLNGHMNGHSSPLSNGHSSKHLVICPEMTFFCFETLLKHLNKQDLPSKLSHLNFTNDRYPLFVSWHAGRDKRLRGCIGTFTPLSLHQGLQEYAITSAMRDSRFSPIHMDEVPKLRVTVSLLTNFEEGSHYLDWEIGIHGIRIEFINDKGHHRSATYLPDVCVEQGWNKEQTIDSLLRKGGYKGSISEQFRSTIKLMRYQSEKLERSYTDYTAYISQNKSGK